MKTFKYILVLITIFSFNLSLSQQGAIKRASKEYHNLAYIKTTEILLKVAEKGYSSVDLFQKLGNSFYFNNEMEDAYKWYKKLMGLNEEINTEYYFRYAQVLKSLEKYNEADLWMQKFYDTEPTDSRGRAFKETPNYLAIINKTSSNDDDLEIKNLDINSPVSDFGTTLYNNKLIIASARGKGKLYKWNHQPFLDLYTVERQENGIYSKVLPFDKRINTKFHESTVTFMPKGSTIYFTRNNFYKKRLRIDETNTNRLYIFKAELQNDNSWGNIKPIHFNSKTYSVAHPSINKTGTKIYFASDMPGTLGESDIYVANINRDGTLGEPTNLGNIINTEGQETFPYINTKGDLYFASNGFPGLGGLDLYVVKNFEDLIKRDKAEELVVKNLGKPINSPQDDFAYFENIDTKEGFFTSNRIGGKGDDDIYSFKIEKKTRVIEGVIKDKDSQELIREALVILFDMKGNKIDEIKVGNDGKFTFKTINHKAYLVRVSKDKYTTDEKRFTSDFIDNNTLLELNIKKEEQEVIIGDDLSIALDIPTIYFDLNKSNIRPDAAIELQKIIQVLQDNPYMKIEVRSHTDSRASSEYNRALSRRRNKSTISYLIEVGGISSNRLVGRGYGEHILVNNCLDGIDCSENQHQANRRSEFIVINN